MAKPPPDSLAKRQYELNTKVNDAFASNLEFKNAEDETNISELDKFFKIDLAAKYKNVDYITDLFREGQTLYVHRALKKCKWLYTDEYSNIINPRYLETNVFSVTSMRVKRLILKTVVMHIRDQVRAIEFYNYCMKHQMTEIALKCLLFTGDEFKLTALESQKTHDLITKQKFSYIRFIIGKSFELLDAYLKLLPTENHDETIIKFKYFYPEDNVKYLELLEKYVVVNGDYPSHPFDHSPKLDKEMCEHIMKKHKERVLSKPVFYMSMIQQVVFIRNITAEDAKCLVYTVLPPTAEGFWLSSFLDSRGKDFLDFVPHSERYAFIKNLFNNKYPGEDFETDISFYNQGYYEYMTTEQQQEWAFEQLKGEKQILGVGNDYLWYKFINFEEAFAQIKKYVIVTKEPELRCNMLITLVQKERSNSELYILFQYYIKRHMNEAIPEKNTFLNEVILHQNVFDFDDTCWSEFYTLLLSLQIYQTSIPDSSLDINSEINEHYKNVTLFYHILNEKDMPPDLMNFFVNDFFPYSESSYGHPSIKPLLQKISDQRRRFLFDYLHTFYSDKINEYKNKPYTSAGKAMTERYFEIVVKLIELFNVNPEIYERQPTQQHKRARIEHPDISDRRLLLDLKVDKDIVIEKLSRVKVHLLDDMTPHLDNFLKKIKIYFPDDIARSFLAMFKELLSEQLHYSSLDLCVNGIFKLADEDSKVELMKEYVPEDPNIDYDSTDHQVISTRKAICRHACNSQPPLPLANILEYMKGDYSRYCLHLFSVYIASLPISKCIELVQSVLDTPVSIQKHALRLAFQCLNAESLKNISMDIWKKTKNVSLRAVIYKSLFNRIIDKNESELRDILVLFTLDLHEDDQHFIFRLVHSNTLPSDFLGEFIKASWTAIGGFKDKEPNIRRKTRTINVIRSHINIMDKAFVKSIIDEHLKTMFVDNKLDLMYSEEDIAALYVQKWNLIITYILTNSCVVDPIKHIELARQIVRKCLEMWHEKSSQNHIYQHCCWEFIQNLNSRSIENYASSADLIPIYEGILEEIEKSLPLHELYMWKWRMQLVIAFRRAMKYDEEGFGDTNKEEIVRETVINFGKEIGTLVSGYVSNKIYCTSLSETIKNIIVERVKELIKVRMSSSDDSTNRLNVALTWLAGSLLDFEMMETYLLAVQIMPSEIVDCDELTQERHQFVLNSVIECPYLDVQSAAHLKLHKPYKRYSAKHKRRRPPPSTNRQRTRNRVMSRRGFGRRI